MRVTALSEIAKVLAAVGESEQSAATSARALAEASAIVDSFERADALKAINEALAPTGYPTVADAALNTLKTVSRLSEELDEEILTDVLTDRVTRMVPVEAIDRIPSIRLRIDEEPLTTKTLNSLTSVVTTLHTKLWLIHQDRFTDLITYTQTRDERFDREANLRVLSLRYNSPLDIKLDVGVDKIGDALQKSIDAFGQAGLRYKEQQLKNDAAALENRLRDLQAQADLADREENRRHTRRMEEFEVKSAMLDIELKLAALDRERLAVQLDRASIV